MTQTRPDNTFIQLLIGCQNRLYGFIFSLLGNADHASDVLQETNRVLWEEADQFKPGTNFMAWALRVAYNQVRTHRRRVQRDRLMFNDEALALIAEEAAGLDESAQEQQQALAECLSKLPPKHEALIRSRYGQGLSVKALAERVGRTSNAVAVALFRVRAALLQCIERKMA